MTKRLTATDALKLTKDAAEPPVNQRTVDYLVDLTLSCIEKAAKGGRTYIRVDAVPTIRSPVTDADAAAVRRELERLGFRYGTPDELSMDGPKTIHWGALPPRPQEFSFTSSDEGK
jgi:hypothetical protein